MIVKNAGVGAGIDNPFDAQKHNTGVGLGKHRYGAFFNPGTGKGFAENMAGAQFGKNRAIAIIILLNNLNFSR